MKSFFARRGFLILFIAVTSLPLIWAGTRQTIKTHRNDVADWLPDAFRETADHRWFQRLFPHEQFVLVSWEGCTLYDTRLDLFAHKLVPESSETSDGEGGPSEGDVSNDLPVIVIEGDVITEAEAAALNPEPWTPPLEQVKPEPRLASEAVPPVETPVEPAETPVEPPTGKVSKPPLFKSVLTGPRLQEQLSSRYSDLTEGEIIDRLAGSLIGPDGLHTCAIVTLTEAAVGKNLKGTLEEIERIAVEECSIPAETLHLGGPPVDNVAIDVEGQRTLYRLAVLSAIVGLGLSMVCFRSLRLTLAVFWMGILAAGMGLAIVFWTRVTAYGLGLVPWDWRWGACDAILLSMPSLVFVLALSGAIHIVNYYHDAIAEDGLLGAPERAIRHAIRPCSIAAVTTALGLGSLIISDILPISKFGLYAATGVLATLWLLFFVLPSILQFFPSRDYAKKCASRHHAEDADSTILKAWERIGRFVVRRNGWVTAAGLAVMVFFIVGLTRIETSVKLIKFFSSDAQIIKDYTWLEKVLGPLVPMEVMVRFDNQDCDKTFLERMRLVWRIERTIENMPDVGGAMSAATFAPNLKRPSEKRMLGKMLADRHDAVLNERLLRHRDEFREYLCIDTERTTTNNPTLHHLKIPQPYFQILWDNELDNRDLIEAHENLAGLEGIGVEGVEMIDRAITAWEKIRNPSLAELEIDPALIAILEDRKLDNLEALDDFEPLERLEGVGKRGKAEVLEAIDKWRHDHGDEVWRVSARVWALTGPEYGHADLDYGNFVNDLRLEVEPVVAKARGDQNYHGVDTVYTGLVPLVYKTQHELMKGLVESLALAFVLIAVVMVVVLRSPSAGLLAMIPNVFPVVVIFGMMGWIGLAVDIGSMMTASVALGVAVDDTIHYLTWYRHGLDLGLDRKEAVMLAYRRCATAMTQTTLIGGFGLAMFAFSTFTPTQRFGLLMLTLLGTALVGDLIFLPALLTGPVGRFFHGSAKKKRPNPDRGDTETSLDPAVEPHVHPVVETPPV